MDKVSYYSLFTLWEHIHSFPFFVILSQVRWHVKMKGNFSHLTIYTVGTLEEFYLFHWAIYSFVIQQQRVYSLKFYSTFSECSSHQRRNMILVIQNQIAFLLKGNNLHETEIKIFLPPWNGFLISKITV